MTRSRCAHATSRSYQVAGIAAALLVAFACTTTSKREYPLASIGTQADFHSESHIDYRELVREDFWSFGPPSDTNAQAQHLGAVLCSMITTDRALELTFDAASKMDDYVFTIANPRYRARMNRDCSWWNTSNEQATPRYILEHEQIHFALSEIYARTINRDVLALRLHAPAREQAASRAQEAVTALLEDAMVKLLEENRKLDEQTAYDLDNDVQRRWRGEVENRLREEASDWGNGEVGEEQSEER